MQLGSGTWDLLPSLTWTGSLRRVRFGGQLSGVRRLESENHSGYALGDAFQATAWGGFALDATGSRCHCAVSTRCRASCAASTTACTPTPGRWTFPRTTAASIWDLGLGSTAVAAGRVPRRQPLRVEWLEPVHDDVNGYQLERTGTLFVTLERGFLSAHAAQPHRVALEGRWARRASSSSSRADPALARRAAALARSPTCAAARGALLALPRATSFLSEINRVAAAGGRHRGRRTRPRPARLRRELPPRERGAVRHHLRECCAAPGASSAASRRTRRRSRRCSSAWAGTVWRGTRPRARVPASRAWSSTSAAW